MERCCRVTIGSNRNDGEPEDRTDDPPEPASRLTPPALFDTSQEVEELGRYDFPDRAIGERLGQVLKEPSGFSDCRFGRVIRLHSFDVFLGNETEGGAGSGLGNDPFQLLLHGRIIAGEDLPLRIVAFAPRIRDRDEGIRTEGEDLLLFREAVLEPPEFRAIRLDEQIEAAAIGELEGLLTGFGVANAEFRQGQVGVSPPVDFTIPPNDTPNSK